jgi:hypothetical protein
MQDGDGNTALHFAASSKAPFEIVEALLEACPEAAAMRGQCGRLPLSIAFLYEAPPACCEAIQVRVGIGNDDSLPRERDERETKHNVHRLPDAFY